MNEIPTDPNANGNAGPSFLDRIVSAGIRFCLENKLIVSLAILAMIIWGIMVAPFDWNLGGLPRQPVPTDAIPDIGENQQIVFTEWMGRSPQDIEDQITYPLTVSLLGVPGVKTIRSYSFFGFSSIYIIFNDDIEFYWSRSRVLEKLSSLSAGTLPEGVQPTLGPDATALGQIFWYTLEGRDKHGNQTGGWDLHELRTIQDWQVRYALLAADGVSEVSSVGGFVQEYQIDVDPDAMHAHGVKLTDVFKAVKNSNVDVGARSIEINRVEYLIRGLGFIKKPQDLEYSIVKVTDNVPLYVKDVAKVSLGPAMRRGALDKGGAEVVGGVVVVRYGENPLTAIKNVKSKIEEISPGLPKKTLSDGTVSQVKIIPFYDRTGLIYETLGTLNNALSDEILVTVIVVLISVMHFTSSMLISAVLPMAILLCFVAMSIFGIDANIVALSGIAIAIGTMVDMGIIVCENILRHLDEWKKSLIEKGSGETRSSFEVIYAASTEVGGAVITSIAMTIIGFLPVFAMEGMEGKLFKPLAFTKSFALLASVILALTMVPILAHLLFTPKSPSEKTKQALHLCMVAAGIIIGFIFAWWAGAIIAAIGIYHFAKHRLPKKLIEAGSNYSIWLVTAIVVIMLAQHWMPLEPQNGVFKNIVFVSVLIGGLLGMFNVFRKYYPALLRWCLEHKPVFLSLPAIIVFGGCLIWLGFDAFFGWLPNSLRSSMVVSSVAGKFPGLGKEFMPPLDEGSFLFMPTTMPHASIGEALDVLQKQDIALQAIPEIDLVVGKLGRAESPLDTAPISMFETVVNYKPEYITGSDGRRLRFRYDRGSDEFLRDEKGVLIADPSGRPFRQWREHIRNPDDIWKEMLKATEIPGTTSAPKLQPIAARLVMLQSGMRAPMGVKVKGPTLESIEKVGLQIERYLKEIPSVEPNTVIADRIIGKPYLEIDIDRRAIARYGVNIRQVQDIIEVAIGGKRITTTVEGRERYPVRVRYLRELRDQIESLDRILIPAPDGAQIPLIQIADIKYLRGPQVIKSEDTFLVGYVVFDKKPEHAEVNVVEEAQAYLKEKIESGEFDLPAGVSYAFAGSYENQLRATRKLMVVVPVALFAIFIILYMQFKSILTALLVFSGIFVAWSGGFIMIWLYSQPWFLNFSVFGTDLRDLFQIHPINLSVAIWVGFLALFGIAAENGVVMAAFLDQVFNKMDIRSISNIREATMEGALKRIRPVLMTSATTILALIPILTSKGRGADIMVPMAIPSFGGMFVALITVLMVPVLYSAIKEFTLNFNHNDK